MAYFDDIKSGIRTTVKGLSLTLRHIRNATKRRTPEGVASDNYFDLQNGLVTLQYPHEQLPIPDNGRYRLRNEIEDCIVCDKCAKVCPVDCITIDAIKATEEVGRASDGSPIRLYAATFDIDMAKCCYCGLCTAVCPTECLTMDKKFDYSEFDLGKLTYQFAELTPAEADEKRALYEQFVREKEEAKAAAKATATPAEPKSPATAKPKPAFRPTAKPAASATPPVESINSGEGAAKHPLTDATPSEMEQIAQGGLEIEKHPTFEATDKSATQDIIREEVTEKTESAAEAPKPKPAFRPSMKPPKPASMEATASETPAEPAKPKPAFRPSMKPPGKPVEPASKGSTDSPDEAAKPKPAFRPTMKPPGKPADAVTSSPSVSESISDEAGPPAAEAPKPKPAFRPTMKLPKSAETVVDLEAPKAEATEEKTDVVSKPAFRPTMKPAKPVEPVNEIKTIEEDGAAAPVPEAPKPAFRPTMNPAKPVDSVENSTPAEPDNDGPSDSAIEPPKPKPAFRPTMKPKSAPPSSPSDEASA
jgi:formate hydrogenlyase subunit 6/NADH:ubiquinone oxidoreductase subunit I